MIIFSPNTIIKSADHNANFASALDVKNHLNPYMFNAYVGTNQTITENATNTVKFNTEIYDFNNNYDPATGRYTVPVDGIYHFDAMLLVNQPDTNGFWGGSLGLKRDRDGVAINLAADGIGFYPSGRVNSYRYKISRDYELKAGDVISLTINVDAYTSANCTIPAGLDVCYFNGRLVRAS